MLGDTWLIWKKKIFLAKLSPMIPKWSRMDCLCRYVFVCICFALYFIMHQNCPVWLRGFFMEITPICRHLSLLQRRRVEGCWQKWHFPFCNRIFNGPQRTSSIPSVFDPVSAEGLFVPRRTPKLTSCMSSSLKNIAKGTTDPGVDCFDQ